jgi:protease-4
MKSFFVRLLAVIGFLAVVVVAAAIAIALVVRINQARVPAKTVLELNLETPLAETPPADPLSAILQKDRPNLRDVVEGLEKAGNDDKVVGLVATIGKAPIGFGQAQEIRDAVLAFRAKKKKAVAFSETFGEFDGAGNSYYIASAFDEIWLQPSGDVMLTGLLAESPFIRGTLDKLGVTPRMDQRYEYKNAMNVYTEKKFTPAHKEATESLVSSLFSQQVRGIAAARKMAEGDVRALIDRGPFLGKEAVDAKLVDGLAYRDEVLDKAKKQAGDGTLLFLSRYLERAGRPHEKGKSTIALVYGIGGVTRGKSDSNPFSDSTTMGSDTVAGALRAAIADDDVKAIVFRVDSPGGSYVASDTIWRETVRAKQKGKPVIVTMGDVAASGGYFVSMSADKIVAQPGTITGSIGVLGGKMITRPFWEDKLGISFDEVHSSANATMWSSLHDYSPTEWARFQAMLDRIYGDFTGKVAEGRKLPLPKVQEIAKGRVWSGEDAKKHGLVDELGGYATALRLARQAAKIPDGEDVQLRVFPKRKNPLEQILEGDGRESSEKAALEALVRTVRLAAPVLRRLEALQAVNAPLAAPLPDLGEN